jgi:hypothetical protein
MKLRVLCIFASVLLAGGCASFPGEWLEEGTINADGTLKPVEGQRRAALKFDWPSTVWYGAYDNLSRLVDHEVVQSGTYFTMQNGKAAQFGAMKARLKSANTLDAYIAGDLTIRFRRVKGDSIFPPVVVVPSLAKKDAQPLDPLVAPVEPVYASSEGGEPNVK